MSNIDEVLTKNVTQILPDKEALKVLMDSKKIRVYLGVDPTGTKLHLGHTIPIRKLQEFADLEHEAILVFGTGTVLTGDPSQRQEARKKITQKEIDENIKSWKSQASKIIDFNKVKIRKNGDWLLKLTVPEIINIASNISAIQLFKREMFRERTKRGDTVWTHETLYPLFQAYDSVAMDVDLEIGGTDQMFNMLIGRELQKKMADREKFVLTTPLISGTDGQPMSKSSGNCIWLDDTPKDMFGKIMSMADTQIEEYWQMLTELSKEELKKLKPIDAKKKLAAEIVKIFHSEAEAKTAREEFERVFQKGKSPEDIPKIKIGDNISIVDFISTQVGSKSEAKRLLDQGAIEVDSISVKEAQSKLKNNSTVRIGKKKFVRIVFK
ncbi:tyrosine--tRNA ligase [Candidatus Curtissbacteria bacterium RIFCSPHIGHO2_02_FULL_42_15]|uniref:Tyrosine--tRNA ligase n=1 Tax=Candidatus Curtissbacteria bacterium RIFCSPHIGHO2_02_FULL_42_15 TaxID=1797716 RepID=A0A1F5GHA9_9BACT|nr:MAG: tyrosine--tRNA ligase [Candidatus Curtissbacteria bacterium RIFCSPHIGHO2_02_FULL_42_15]